MVPEMVADAVAAAVTLPMTYQYDSFSVMPTAPIGALPATFEELVQEMMRRMAELAKGLGDEHMNREALAEMMKSNDALGGLDEVEKMLTRGDVEGAMKALDQLGNVMQQMLSSLERTAGMPGQKNAELMKDMLAFKRKLEDVQRALAECDVYLMTISEVQGFGKQRGVTEVYRAQEIEERFIPKLKIEIAVNAAFVEATIEAIVRGGRSGATGKVGDGKIFVLPLEECVRIRTGEAGELAIGP